MPVLPSAVTIETPKMMLKDRVGSLDSAASDMAKAVIGPGQAAQSPGDQAARTVRGRHESGIMITVP